MMGRIHLDLFAQPKYLLDGVDLHLKLNQSHHSFNLMGVEAADFVVCLHNVSLFVRKVKISPSIKVSHAKALAIAPGKYVTCRVEMKTCTIQPNGYTLVQENPFLGALSRRMTFAFIKLTAVNDVYIQNPFNLEHFGNNFIALFVNG